MAQNIITPPKTTENRVVFSRFSDSLADAAFLQTDFINLSEVDKYQIGWEASATGLTLTIESKDFDEQTPNSDSFTYTSSTLFLAFLPPRQRFLRFTLTNNTGVAVTNVSFTVKTFVGGSDKASVFPISIAPREFSAAMLTQSVLIGKDYNGDYRNTAVNDAGAMLVSDWGTDVALNRVNNYSINTKFGRNPDIDTGSTPEDVWNGGSDYTGFNCVVAETLSVVSDSAADRGLQISSGTATGFDVNILEDSGANFTGDGVQVGDLIINDTQQFHGIVSLVNSDTQLTVHAWYNGDANNNYSFVIGDTYRVAQSVDTGAAVLKLGAALDGDYNSQTEYVIMNGTTAVLTTKLYLRQTRGIIETAGSTFSNVGEITARQSTTTANITMVMPAVTGQSAIACATIPSNKMWLIKNFKAAMIITGNKVGSASIEFQSRTRGGAWQTKRYVAIGDGIDYSELLEGGILLDSQTDVRWRVVDVFANNTQVNASFEYYEIDK